MAVTVNKEIISKNAGGLLAVPVASGETIYKGTLVCIGADGYLHNITSTQISGGIRVVGIVADDAANDPPQATTANGSISGDLEEQSAIAGDKTVRLIYTKGLFKLPFTSITQAMVGSKMYATDNYTIDDDSTSAVEVGYLATYLSATEGWLALNSQVD